MSVLISVPIGMAISQYSNLNHACVEGFCKGNSEKVKLNEQA